MAIKKRRNEDETGRDLQGRPYATVAELKAGDKVVVDGDFDCIKPGTEVAIERSEESDGDGNHLFMKCRMGRHYLSGQIDDTGTFYVGLYPVKDETA